MSEKYNRGNIIAVDDQFYFEDYIADIDGLEEDIRTTVMDLQDVPAIISGLAITLNIGGGSVDISAGVAYDKDARRISIPEAETALAVNTTLNAINYVCIKHKYSLSDARNAYRTGVRYYTRKYDDYELAVKTEAEGPPEDLEAAGYVVLASTTGTGSGVAISYINRTSPDLSGTLDIGAPAQVTGLSLTTSDEPSLIYNSGDNPILTQMITAPDIHKAFIRVEWDPITDPSGISHYEVELIPINDSDQELPNYLESARVGYNQI
jgi:hypothetical protein